MESGSALLQRYAYGVVPPVDDAVADPLLPPKQETMVGTPMETTGEFAFGTVTIAESTQPFTSVNTTVYVPARSPVAVDNVPPEGDHTYVHEPVPPVTLTEAEPFAAPHVDCVNDVVAASAVGSVTVADAVNVQPFASVITQVYGPAMRFAAVEAVPPEGAHRYVYGPMPPDAFTAALPVLPPKQSTAVEVEVAASAVGCETVAEAEVVQPFASVVTTV